MQIKGRLTIKKLMGWIQSEFVRLEINNYEVYNIERTRFRSQDYESGACFLYVRFRYIQDHSITGTFQCFYSISEYEKHIKNGYKLKLKFDRHYTLPNITVELEKY